MKQGIKAIGKAVIYFTVYLLIQMLVSIVFSMVISEKITMEMMASGEIIDETVITELLTIEIMNHMMTMTVVSGVVTLVVFWIVFLIRKKKFMKEVCLYKIPIKGILPIISIAVGFNVITTCVISFFPWPQSWIDSYVANSSAIDNSLMSWITAVLAAPVLEEIVFRGLVYTRLKKGLPMFVAAVITSLVFGFVHGTIIWGIYTFVFSILLIWVFESFHSLTACILLHMAYNFAGMLLSLIPEDAGGIILILFGLSIAGVRFAYKEVTGYCSHSS